MLAKERKALKEALEYIGRSYEEQGEIFLRVLATYDHAFFDRIRERDGEEKASALHKDSWVRQVPDYVRDGKDILKLGEPTDIPSIGRIMKHVFEARGCVFTIATSLPDRFVGIIRRCALSEHAKERFGDKAHSPYQRSLSEVSKGIINGLIEECGLVAKVEAEMDRFMCLGDGECRVIVRAVKGKKGREIEA